MGQESPRGEGVARYQQMKFLFIHQNFPGQFKFLAPALVEAGHEVTALVPSNSAAKAENHGTIGLRVYPLLRGNTQGIHDWVIDLETKVIRGQSCAQYALKMRSEGYEPDIIIAHPGWGESLFLKNVWPDALLKIYCEYYYLAEGGDVGFDSEYDDSNPLKASRLQMKNLNMLSHCEVADQLLAPSRWQASTFPERIADRITVIHDGVDTGRVKRPAHPGLTLPSGLELGKSNKIVTYVARNLEPHRGFHTFMRAAPRLLAADSDLQVLIIGSDAKGYGLPPASGLSWKQTLEAETLAELSEQDRSRVHFLGKLPYREYLSVLSVSTVHIYLTYPFVLSWSLIEAMSMGCAIVASDTTPVSEVITHDEQGLLVDFFSPAALAASVQQLLSDEAHRARLGSNARKKIVEEYDLKTRSLPRLMAWACNTD